MPPSSNCIFMIGQQTVRNRNPHSYSNFNSLHYWPCYNLGFFSSPVADRPQSFGLHSPDQLPKTESEFRAIASSFGLHSPDTLPSELLHPSYNPRLFCDGGLYLDPDIIGKCGIWTEILPCEVVGKF